MFEFLPESGSPTELNHGTNRGKKLWCFRSGFNHISNYVNYIIGVNFHFLFEIEPIYDVITMSHTKQNVIGTFSFAWD